MLTTPAREISSNLDINLTLIRFPFNEYKNIRPNCEHIYINYNLKSHWFSAHVQASVHVLHSSYHLVSLLIWTYCLISCSLSLADGAVHWQIKYCNGTAKARTINCRTRGILAKLLQISLLCHKDFYLAHCVMAASFPVTLSSSAFLDGAIKETCRD